MKSILAISLLALASCATQSKGWDIPGPNNRANIADTVGPSRSGMTDQEMRELTRPEKEKRFSGELSFGVGGRF